MKAKFFLVLVSLLASITASAITATKEYVDRRDAETLQDAKDYADAHAVNTNEVERIANRAVETNAVTVATTNRIADLETATNNLQSSVSGLASRTGADITTGGGYTHFGYTNPDNDISFNIQQLDGGIVETQERLDEFADEAYDAFAQKEEVVANQDGEANDLTVNGMTVNYDATFNGNVNIGPNSLYIDGTLLEEVFGGFTPRGIFNSLNNDFDLHKGNTNIHVKVAEKASWNAKLSSSDVIDPASATTTGKAADALKTKQELAAKVDSDGDGGAAGYASIGYSEDGLSPMLTSDIGSGTVFYDRLTYKKSILVPDDSNVMTSNMVLSIVSPTDPTFSNAVLAVGIDTNVLAAVAASTNAVAQIGEFYAAFSDIGLTPTQGGMTLAGLLAALVAAVTWLKMNKADKSETATIVKLEDGTETMAEIKARLDAINTAGKHVFFDTAAIDVTNPLYLCTVFIDADEGILRLQDQVTGKQYIGAYDETETLAQVLSKAVDAYVSIQVSAATKDINPSTGTTYPVVGQTVYLHEGEDATGPVRETAAYDGVPVSFMVPKGFRYFIRMSNTLQGHFNPHTPVVGADKGVANANLSIAFEYDDFSTVDTFAGIQAALANFHVTEAGAEAARTALVYKGEDVRVIADTWTDYDVTPPVSYDDPMVLLDVRVVEGEDGQSHLAAIMMRQYGTKRSIQFDAPQYGNKCAAGETVDGSLTYYGWLDSSDGSADVYGETAPMAYTSAGLEVLHGGAAYKLKSNMTVAAGDPWDADKWTALADSANPGNANALHVLSGLQTGQALPTNYRAIFKSSINDSTRNVIIYGYNRYENSGWRSYLTADPDDPKGADENGWWKKHAYGTQIAPSGATYSPYQKGCSAALLNAAKQIKVKCLANTVTDGGGSYEVCDKIWLPCIKDLFGTSNSDEARTPSEYWQRIIGPIGDPPAPADPNNNLAAINGFRIFKNVTSKTGSAVYLRLRSAFTGYSCYVWLVSTTGLLNRSYTASAAYAAVPACAIY